MRRLSLGPALILAGLAGLVYGDDQKVEPVRPRDGVIRLFNGQDLTGLSTWLKDTKREDPRKVFTAHDGRASLTRGVPCVPSDCLARGDGPGADPGSPDQSREASERSKVHLLDDGLPHLTM